MSSPDPLRTLAWVVFVAPFLGATFGLLRRVGRVMQPSGEAAPKASLQARARRSLVAYLLCVIAYVPAAYYAQWPAVWALLACTHVAAIAVCTSTAMQAHLEEPAMPGWRTVMLFPISFPFREVQAKLPPEELRVPPAGCFAGLAQFVFPILWIGAWMPLWKP